MSHSNVVEQQLLSDNHAMKVEIENLKKRCQTLHHFELSIQQVHNSHEELLRSAEKKEQLERAIRYKLEIELRRLHAQNQELKEQHEAALASMAAIKKSSTDGRSDENEIQKRDLLIAQLLTQNKELLGDKETQEYELQAQRLTLEEQRNHIEILDSALMYAQNNVIKLEAELRKKQAYEERANHLQKALANLQLASDRRLQMEKRVRTHLEKEIENLKRHINGKGQHSMSPSNLEFDELKKTAREYEEKIIHLETEVTKWEQRYLEESALRHIEVNAASVPKDAKIAALERTSQESERIITEARSERLQHMDELHASKKKCAELESKTKDMETKIAEKDAMIKALQQHTLEKDAFLQKSLTAAHARSASMSLMRAPACDHKPPPAFPRHDYGKFNSSTLGKDSKNSSNISSLKSASVDKATQPITAKREPTNLLMTKERSVSSASSSPSSGIPESAGSASASSSNGSISKPTFDEQLKDLDERLSTDSIIKALRSEKERYPNHFWRL